MHIYRYMVAREVVGHDKCFDHLARSEGVIYIYIYVYIYIYIYTYTYIYIYIYMYMCVTRVEGVGAGMRVDPCP